MKMLFRHMAQQCLLRKRRIFTACSKASPDPQLRMVRCPVIGITIKL